MKNKRITLLVLLFVFLQSCTVYNSTSVSLEEATDKGKVRVFNNAGLEWVFKEIQMKDSVFYGVTSKDTLKIRQNQVSTIYTIDKEESERKTKLLKKSLLYSSIPMGAGLTVILVSLVLLLLHGY